MEVGEEDLQRIANADQLLLPEKEADKKWESLPDDDLCAQIEIYRDRIKDISSRLRDLGEPVDEEDEDDSAAVDAVQDTIEEQQQQDDAAAGAAQATGKDVTKQDNEFAHLGEEGVDYTFGNVDDLDPTEWQVPPHCIPIHANVTTYDWSKLYSQHQFDVIMMDPPWQLATANPTRGVALGYSQLNDDFISGLPIPQLQQNGLLFIWVINAKYKWTLDLFERWGYELVDEIVWVKMTVNRRLAKSHGYYLQHAKEVCLVGKRGNNPPGMVSGVASDIIYSERRGQSQKPEEIYQIIEELVPNGRYLEIFARKNNLRNFWVSVGNEVTGTGLPEEDMEAVKDGGAIPNAVYGKTGGD